jgi:uncharacterized protein YjcR
VINNMKKLRPSPGRAGPSAMTLRQVAEKFGVAPVTARQWRERGHFPNAKLEETVIGPVWIVPVSDVEAFTPPAMGRPKKANKETEASKRDRKPGARKVK